MGNGQSDEESDKVGYRILGVQPNSPGSSGGFVSFFDFIVAANGVPLRNMDSTFVDLIKAFEDKQLTLTVYNCKSHTLREVVLTPSRNWPGEGYLGVIIRFDTFYEADEHLCHVLDVEVNSPAELAGLQPGTDYLLGTTDLVFKDSNVLYDTLSSHIDKPIEIYVFNIETDEVRIAVLMPSTDWGGDGILGASVAHGYMHRLPSRCSKTIGKSYEASMRGLQSPFGYNNTIFIQPKSEQIHTSQKAHLNSSETPNPIVTNTNEKFDSHLSPSPGHPINEKSETVPGVETEEDQMKKKSEKVAFSDEPPHDVTSEDPIEEKLKNLDRDAIISVNSSGIIGISRQVPPVTLPSDNHTFSEEKAPAEIFSFEKILSFLDGNPPSDQ